METADQMAWELSNLQSNGLYFKVSKFSNNGSFKEMDRLNYFTVILLLEGDGQLIADLNSITLNGNALITLSPYQPVNFHLKGNCTGYMVNFHADFFCLHQHRNEVSCNGVLFNNIYSPPVISLTTEEAQSLTNVISGMIMEMRQSAAPEYEILLAFLKVLLVAGSRMKLARQGLHDLPGGPRNGIVDELKTAIEQKFRVLHGPGEYAALLNTSTAALNRAAKTYFNKTFSQLIGDRIIVEAKRELYLTAKPIKLIAYELGFHDEFYFSRYFKQKLNVSPQLFRDTVGFNKA